MSELHSVKKGRKPRKKTLPVLAADAARDHFLDEEGAVIDSRHLLISALLPPAVKAFLADLNAEVAALCGARYSHGAQALRWGRQNGSIVLGRQRVAIERPRIRDREGQEIPIETYARFQDPELFDEAVFSESTESGSRSSESSSRSAWVNAARSICSEFTRVRLKARPHAGNFWMTWKGAACLSPISFSLSTVDPA
jgi:hypothetical protein